MFWAVSRCRPGSDKENDVYSYSHQGHEVAGNYVYFYEGNAVETGADSFASKAYVTVFNYSGKIVVPAYPMWQPSPMQQGSPLQGLPRRGMPRVRA